MAAVPITLAFLVLCATITGFSLAELASDLKRKKRAQAHDTASALSPLMAQLERIQAGMTDDVSKAKQLVMAIRAAYHPEGEASIRLAQYLKLLLSGFADVTEFYASSSPAVMVDLGDLHRILVNIFTNAIEAREAAGSDKPIRVHLTENSIAVGNPANEVDRVQISKVLGSTRGPNRGIGKRSVLDSCKRIGWEVVWEVVGDKVITTLNFE